MKNYLNDTLQSVIKSYNSRTPINYTDLAVLDNEFTDSQVVSDLIDSYNNRTLMNYSTVRDLEILISKTK